MDGMYKKQLFSMWFIDNSRAPSPCEKYTVFFMWDGDRLPPSEEDFDRFDLQDRLAKDGRRQTE